MKLVGKDPFFIHMHVRKTKTKTVSCKDLNLLVSNCVNTHCSFTALILDVFHLIFVTISKWLEVAVSCFLIRADTGVRSHGTLVTFPPETVG